MRNLSQKEQIIQVEPPLGGVNRNLASTAIEPQLATKCEDISITSREIKIRPGTRKLGDELGEVIVGARKFTTYEDKPRTIIFTTEGIYYLLFDTEADKRYWQPLPILRDGSKALYFYGIGFEDWQEGYDSDGIKTDFYEENNEFITLKCENEEIAAVTKDTYNFDNIDMIRINWELSTENSTNLRATLQISSNQMGDISVYDESRLEENSPFSLQCMELDVSNVTGDYYIRFHVEENSNNISYLRVNELILQTKDIIIEWSLTPTDQVDTTMFPAGPEGEEILVITSRPNPVLTWTGEDEEIRIVEQSTPDGGNYSYKNVTTFANRLVFANGIDLGGDLKLQRVRWTQVGAHDEFYDGRANFVDLIDSPGAILNILPLGNELAIYKNDSIILCSFTGGIEVFNFQSRISNIGLLTPKAVASRGESHYFLGRDNIYQFIGGREPEPIGDPIIDTLLTLVNDDYIDRIVAGVHDNEIWFCIPVNSEYADTVFSYDVTTGQWSIYNLEITAISKYRELELLKIGQLEGTIREQTGRIGDYGSVDLQHRTVIANPEGRVYLFNHIYGSDDGEPITGIWESKDFTLSEGYMTRLNRLRAIQFEARGEEVIIEYSTDQGKSWEKVDTVSLKKEYDQYRLWIDDMTRILRIRFKGSIYRVRSFGIMYREGAMR